MNMYDCLKSLKGVDFRSAYRKSRDPCEKTRLLALHHLQAGKSPEDVSRAVLYSHNAVRRWLKAFAESGHGALFGNERRARPPKPHLPRRRIGEFRKALEDARRARRRAPTVREVHGILVDRFGCRYSFSGVYGLMRRLDIAWAPPATPSRPGKPDAPASRRGASPSRRRHGAVASSS